MECETNSFGGCERHTYRIKSCTPYTKREYMYFCVYFSSLSPTIDFTHEDRDGMEFSDPELHGTLKINSPCNTSEDKKEYK